jgi:hypothetical protein
LKTTALLAPAENPDNATFPPASFVTLRVLELFSHSAVMLFLVVSLTRIPPLFVASVPKSVPSPAP